MNFYHSEDRQMLSDTLVRLLANQHAIEKRNQAAYGPVGYDPALWAQLTELGVVGALFPPEAGGFGGEGFDIAVVFEALGGALSTEPMLGAVMAAPILQGRAEHAALIEQIIAGSSIVALACEEAEATLWDMPRAAARPSGDGWILNGAKAVVAHAEAAHQFIVSAVIEGSEDQGLFLLPADAKGVTVQGYGLVDGGRGGEVLLSDVSGQLIAAGAEAEAALASARAAGLLALSAEALGVMERIKTDTLEYLRARIQFGTPIGSFQALQHRMATVLLEIEQARSAVINAAAALAGAPLERDKAGAAAKVTIGRVGSLTAEEAIQMHGGIGMTWELAMSHYAKRAIMIDQQMGDQDFHLARYISLTAAA
jgi:alkylation response protein AidB-like acyl-CoA dehydrogenase